MKKNYLYLTALGAAALASCSNEIESLEKTGQTDNKYASELVGVSKDFKLVGGYENTGVDTRAEWNFDGQNRDAISKWAWRSTDIIGAAWVGKNYNTDGTINHDFTPALNGKVLSNYQFDIIRYSANSVKDYESMTMVSPENDATEWTNRTKGTFQTNNLKMFGGDYIVYTPFDENLTEEGYITMNAPTELTQAELSDQDLFQNEDNEKYFNAYGYSQHMIGAQEVIGANINEGSFALRPLNRIVAARLTTKEEVKDVKKMYIYSKAGEIYTQNGLSAAKIAQGEIEASSESKKITTLPYENGNDKIQTTTAVRTTLTTAGNVSPNELNDEEQDVVLADKKYIKTYNEQYIYSMLMPVNFASAWEVIITKETQKAAKRVMDPYLVNPSSDYLVITMGKNADENSDFDTYVAFDCPEFETAATNAQTDLVPVSPGVYKKWPFRILREVEYGKEEDHTNVTLENVTLEGQKVNVAKDATLIISSNTAFEAGFTIENHGTVVVEEGANLDNLTIDNYGDITLEDGAVLSATVNDKAEGTSITVAADATASITGVVAADDVTLTEATTGKQTILDVTGTLNFDNKLTIPTEDCKFNVKGNGQVTAQKLAIVENYGTVNLDGPSTTMKIEAGAQFVDRIGSHMGGYALKNNNMQVYGEYICEVNTQELFDDVMAQKKAVVTKIRITTGYDAENDKTTYILDNKGVTNYVSENTHQTEKQIDLEVNLENVTLNVTKDNAVTFGRLIVNKGTATVNTKTDASSDNSVLKLTQDVEANAALTLSGGAKVEVTENVVAKDAFTVGKDAKVTVTGNTSVSGVTIIDKATYTTHDLKIAANTTMVKTGSTLTVNNNLTVDLAAKIEFENDLTAEVANAITNNGTFTILNAISASSTTAIVKCGSYSNNGTWGTNNLPIVR